jgi:hypothetical protein
VREQETSFMPHCCSYRITTDSTPLMQNERYHTTSAYSAPP